MICSSMKDTTLITVFLILQSCLHGRCVMPSCAYPGFLGILLCGFLCLLSLCIFVSSGSPHEPILLIALLIYDSMHAALPHIQLCATPTFL